MQTVRIRLVIFCISLRQKVNDCVRELRSRIQILIKFAALAITGWFPPPTGSTNPPLSKGKLRLYSMRFCPYAQRVHLVLDAKKIL
jgi:hypothetical protein